MPLGSGELLNIKCVSVNNQQYIVRPTLINLNPDELHYYPFIVSIDRFNGSFNSVNYPFHRIWVPKDRGHQSESIYMVKGINKLTTLAKDTSCDCRCKFDGRKCS